MPRRPLALLLLALPLAACRTDDAPKGPLQVRENAFTWSGHVPAGARLSVRSFAGGIDVQPSPDDTARVTARLEWRSGDPDRSLTMSGARVGAGADALICAVWGDGSCTADNYTANFKPGRGTDAKLFFTVQVPAGVRLTLTQIAGPISAAASAPVIAKTMDGDIRVATAVGPVQGETFNGSVDIRMSSLAGTDSVIAKTLNGDAFIYLAALDDARIDLGVMNGSVESAFPAEAPPAAKAKKLQATIGAGSRVIRGHTLNGRVALRKLDTQGRSQ